VSEACITQPIEEKQVVERPYEHKQVVEPYEQKQVADAQGQGLPILDESHLQLGDNN
jgi:hypothetical protein